MVIKIGSFVFLWINKYFYIGQVNAIVGSASEEAWRAQKMFKEFGSLNDSLHELSYQIIKRKKWSQEELKKAFEVANNINNNNCDFRIYELKKFIQSGIECNID